jgi:hypothetical protein
MLDWQFWLNWIVQLGIALGTISAVLVALFGRWLRARFAPPELKLSLSNVRGVPSPCLLTSPDGQQRVSQSRWYHVRLDNDRRWSPATQTQIVMLEIQEPDARGEMKAIWLGAMPLKWRSVGYLPFGKTIGSWSECDLCSVVQDGWLDIHPAILESPMKSQRTGQCRFIVVLQARSVEVDANVLRIEIAWNGQWSDDTDQMARNLVLKSI